MKDKDTIDLKELMRIVAKYKYRFIALILICTVSAFAISYFLPKKYESTVVVRAKGPKQSSISLQAAAAAMALLGGGGGGASASTQTYIDMIKSRSVLQPVLEQLDFPNKDKMDPKGLFPDNLKVQVTKGTDLLEITGIGRTPEEAQLIATATTTSFQQLLTRMNQSEQSLMMKFLKERLIIAKQDMEKAEQNLERFSQQEKIYIPDEQAKALITKLNEYDKTVAKFQVEVETNQAKLQGVNDQLTKQNVAISAYNMVDNPGIQQIKETIIKKEMALVEQQQRYTDKHPNIILLNKEIDELKAKLKEEIDQSILAGTNTLNPIHAGLLKEKVTTETELLAGQASVGVAKKIQAENEQEISKLSAGSVTYIGLERQAKISQEVYVVLVKNYEQTRIQEAMESMDIQIVDQAVLPKGPSWPNTMLITLIGSVVGIMLSFFILIILYSRQTVHDKF